GDSLDGMRRGHQTDVWSIVYRSSLRLGRSPPMKKRLFVCTALLLTAALPARGDYLSFQENKTAQEWVTELKAKDAAARAKAAQALGQMGTRGKEAIPALTAALKDEDAAVRGRAAVALWRI